MEVLKELDRITEADERQQHFAVVDNQTGEYRRLTLEDVYRQTESIQLHNPVPDKVKSHFSTAKNLLVYSWYHYPFNVTAQFLAFVTVEMALKRKKPGQSPFRKLTTTHTFQPSFLSIGVNF
ncbi:MAG: hypothetical protein JAY84_16080 [Candidatus Thiodiazotropha taylori]|nr:hypothetical protein [Candidatus Thiodiazotropha taylori]